MRLKTRGLKWARLLEGKPPFITEHAPPSDQYQAEGLHFESLVVQYLEGRFENTKHGPWFQFRDAKGMGWCQPDILVITDSYILVIECKRTYTEEGITKLLHLYRPVIRKALKNEDIRLLLICHNLLPSAQNVVSSLKEGIEYGKETPAVWRFEPPKSYSKRLKKPKVSQSSEAPQKVATTPCRRKNSESN